MRLVSYHKAVVERQYWRCLTASFSHVSGVHLLFNMSSLWSLGVVEQMGYRGDGWGSGWYVRYTLVMLVGTMVLVLAAYHALARWAKIERYERVTAVGYSCVVFGWMTVLSVKRPTHALSPRFHRSPREPRALRLAPVHLCHRPRASFVGHLAGILMGYLVAWGVLPVDELVLDRCPGLLGDRGLLLQSQDDHGRAFALHSRPRKRWGWWRRVLRDGDSPGRRRRSIEIAWGRRRHHRARPSRHGRERLAARRRRE